MTDGNANADPNSPSSLVPLFPAPASVRLGLFIHSSDFQFQAAVCNARASGAIGIGADAMNDHEAQRIAAAAHELRPDWPASSVLTLIRKHMLDKPRRDVGVALAWVACESGTATPARVLETGPWWRAAAVEGQPRPKPWDATTSCGICSQEYDKCRQLWTGDHEYERADAAAANKLDSEALAGIIDELRDRLAAAKVEQPEPVERAKTKPKSAEDHEAAMEEAAAHGHTGQAEWHATRADMKAAERARRSTTETTTDPAAAGSFASTGETK